MKRCGMSLIELLLIVAILGVLISLAIPSFTSVLDFVKRDACINNLRQIHLAKEQWGLENGIEVGDTGSTPDATDLDPYVKNGTDSLICPLDGSESFATSYTINTLGTYPECKIEPSTHEMD